MSFYNMLFGINPDYKKILSLLDLKEEDIERFRDCGLKDGRIYIYTRTGGDNRECFPNEILTSNPHYLYDENDDFDSTYATYYFSIPEDENNMKEVGLQDVEKICKK